MFYDNLLPPNSVPEQYCSVKKIMAYNNKTLILYLIDFGGAQCNQFYNNICSITDNERGLATDNNYKKIVA